MKIEELEKSLKQGILGSLYLLYGEEKYLINNCVKNIEKLFGEKIAGINFVLIDENNVNEIISDIQTPAFGFERKLIVAKNTGLFKKDAKKKTKNDNSNIKVKLTSYLEENIDILKKDVVLVFIEETAEKCELLNIFEKHGIVCESEYLKPFQIQTRIKNIANLYGVNIDKTTIDYFIECCGTDMQELVNEIRKLIEYEGKGNTITKQDIDKLSIKKIESIIFDLTDNLGKKNIEESLKVLKNLIYAKEPIQKIFITLYNHFKKLYITKIAVNEKLNLAESLNLKANQTFLAGKYRMQSGYFKEAELKKLLKEFIDLDYKVKNGMMDINVGLESILCRYCS